MSMGKILVVDDNEMNRDMLYRRLERQRYDVDVAEDGERCLELVRQNPYELVLLDIMMPGLNGYEVLEKMKSDDDLRHIPVIMISAVDDLDSVVRCIEMGAEDYLFKPFNPVLLKARVTAVLDRSRLVQAALASARVDFRAVADLLNQLRSGEHGPLNQTQTEVLGEIDRLITNGL